MKDNLKSCPFCGGEGKLETMLYGGTAVSCQNTDCGFYGYNVETSMWNTRPNDAKWISVEDEPKKNGHYQIWDNGYGEGLFHDGEWKSTDRPAKNAMGVQCLRVTLHPTHYMPLPTPPKQSSEGEEG